MGTEVYGSKLQIGDTCDGTPWQKTYFYTICLLHGIATHKVSFVADGRM